MRRLQFILVFLTALVTLASGLGLDPLSYIIPSAAPFTLPGLLAVALIGVLLYRARDLERLLSKVDQTTQERWTGTDARLVRVTEKATQNSQAVAELQNTLAHYEWLLPGKILLWQRRPEDAVKVLQSAVAQHPEHRAGRWALGEALHGAKRYPEALPHLLAGLTEKNVTQLSLVAQCEQALGRHAEAETHLKQMIEARGERRQEDLMALGAVQSELEPQTAKKTLSEALKLNPYNSAVRYQLLDLETRTGNYESAIELATEGLNRNPADVGCFVSRAEAYFRRGLPEDEELVIRDLGTVQSKNRKDYNIYRLRGALYQRRATQTASQEEARRALQQALDAYEDGLSNIPVKFHAHLLAAESRVLVQLRRFDDAVKKAQGAIERYSGHVSNHLALAFARLAARQWQAAAQAAGRGIQWAGWGGKIWLTAIVIFAQTCEGKNPANLRRQCTTLVEALEADVRSFKLTENWNIVRNILHDVSQELGEPHRSLVIDTIALLEKAISPQDYRTAWIKPQSDS
ncbi:MAG: tetratricopeptide repeat protein [Candidatus Tectomicrobia bacterium]|nr:tetratricopeptide repeat protein [Candidatus Tectomicrobia bacterium]